MGRPRKTQKTDSEARTLAQRVTADNNTFRDNLRPELLEETKTTARKLDKPRR